MPFKLQKFNFGDFSSIGSIPPPKFDMPVKDIFSNEELTQRQIEKQNEILEFLKAVTIDQSKTAENQSKNNLWMTGLALVFAFISIVPIIHKWTLPDETKILYQNISELERQLSSESKRNLEMYESLLDLQNQVKTLEKQNELNSSKEILK